MRPTLLWSRVFLQMAAAVLLAGALPEARAGEAAEAGGGEGTPGEESVPAGAELYGLDQEVTPPLDESGEMIEAEPSGYRVIFRPSVWLAWSTSEFRNGAGAAVFSLEDDFDVFRLQAMLPLEGIIRTENQEFRLRFLWWTRESDAKTITGSDFVFGGETFLVGDRVAASLATYAVGLDLLHRILDKPTFDLYIAAGCDFFHTSLELSGAGKSDTLEETIPIFTIGLGFRFNVRQDLSVFLSHTALSLSQLLFLDEEFFANRDVYRSIELSVMWEKTDKIDLGAGWRYYDVNFKSDRLKAGQVMSGPSCWVRFKF